MPSIFLTAEWRYLVMRNYAIDPAALRLVVPEGTELDFFEGETYVSIVGFRFLETEIFGVGIPLFRNFEEVNLRFYVRRKTAEGWRRGVAFVRELVPRRGIAFIARTVYGEPYSVLPMRHTIEQKGDALRVEYSWKRGQKWESVGVLARGEPQPLVPGSHEEFIAEHYWGYTARRGGLSEYRVEHSPWRIWCGTESYLHADFVSLYGDLFAEALSARPVSAFIAEGSPVTVYKREKAES